jgi:hypothetical protein
MRRRVMKSSEGAGAEGGKGWREVVRVVVVEPGALEKVGVRGSEVVLERLWEGVIG